VFRYAEVQAILRDGRYGRERTRAGGADPAFNTVIRRVARQMLLFADPPRHGRLRRVMTAAMSPELQARAVRRAGEFAPLLLDMALAEDAPDIVRHFAAPLPIMVMADLLGFPVDDHGLVKAWSTDIAAITDLRPSDKAVERSSRATMEAAEYLQALVGERRRRPQDDVLSRLIATRVEGERLSDGEILANALLLLVAGHETTVGLVGYAVKELLDRPALAADMDASDAGVTLAVEELLRFVSPVQMTFRVAHEPTEVAGVHIEPGDTMGLVLGSANRDPAEFVDPERLDLTRAARRHLAFGAGPHHCLGSTLARAEARAALQAVAPVLPSLSYDPTRLVRSDNFLFRALAELPVTVT
jgi:cytochrome P450